jgi:cobalt-zinc-cadmium efflux system protein
LGVERVEVLFEALVSRDPGIDGAANRLGGPSTHPSLHGAPSRCGSNRPIAIVINLLSAWLLSGGEHDLNIRGAFLHLIADAAVSLAVVIAGGMILLTGWYWVDPVASLVISAVIVWGTWGLLRDAVSLSLHALHAVPADIELADVRGYLETLPGVSSIHDLHIWAMSTTEIALTCHLVMPYGAGGDEFIDHLCAALHRRFGIEHSTVQIETDYQTCRLAQAHVV